MARAMKESGIEWIGKIPEDWEMTRMKSCISERDGGSWGEEPTGGEGDVICLRIADFDYSKFKFKDVDDISELTKRNYNIDIINKLALKKNDIVIEKSGGGEKTPVGRTVIFDKEYTALYANFCDRLRCREIVSPNFMQYVFVTFYANRFVWNYIKQTTGIQNLDLTSMLSKEYIYTPHREEQQKIANFLDSKCASIDAVIEKTKASIEEYKKLKQASITQAVTKGIRGERELKDSKTGWMGYVPKDWKYFRINNLYAERKEKGIEDLPILQVSIHSGITDHEIADEDADRVFIRSEDRTKYQRVYPGDLAYNMMRAWQGAFGAVRVEGMISPAYVAVKPKDSVSLDSRYMEALFRTPMGIEEMHRYSYGVADFRLRLYWQAFRNIRVCIPPIEEQIEIADYIDNISNKYDEIINKKLSIIREIEKLKKSVVYEYVTGKKEVSA